MSVDKLETAVEVEVLNELNPVDKLDTPVDKLDTAVEVDVLKLLR